MNLLQISLTNRCNMECAWCPIAKWRNNPDYPNKLCNERLLPFLDKLEPQEWAIELTGGEPALYEELDELLGWLQAKGFRGLVKTNGSLRIRRVPSFKRAAAFHELAKPPYFYDEILIISGLPDFHAKMEWCMANGAEYGVIELDRRWRPSGRREPHGIGKIMFLNPEGHLQECSADGESRIPIEDGRLATRKACRECKTAMDFMTFFKPKEDSICCH
jgi:hypothetical protein